MTNISIGNKIISNNSKIFTIAEIGINHNGLINKAIKMIDYAVEAKFDAVKFQTFDLDNMLLRETKLANYQKKTRYSNFRGMVRWSRTSKK